jgi:hypothetical protein
MINGKTPVWFQLTGTHHPAHPESILHKDGHYCAYGFHSMDDATLQETREKNRKGEKVNYNALKHTRQRVRPHKDGKYPENTWVYDNKAPSRKMMNVARQMYDFDDTIHFVVFSTFPMLSVLNMFKAFKEEFRDNCTLIYYKRHFWESEVGKFNGAERSMVNTKDGALDEHISNKEIETAIIEEADKVFLAESLNTMGTPELDSNEEITRLLDFRDEYLRENPKVISYSINDRVYEVINGLK